MSLRLKHVVALVAVGAASTRAARAQTPAPACPSITVTAGESVAVGAPAMFTVNVSGGDPNVSPTYNWSTSTGKIAAGQGTASVVVETQDAKGTAVMATVDVGGFARQCPYSKSASLTLRPAPGPAVMVASYETPDLAANEQKLRIFATELAKDPTAKGWVIAYGGRRSKPEDAEKAALNATEYATNKLKTDVARTLSGTAGYRETPTIELWVWPEGGAPPRATPTVDPKDVKPF